MSIGARPPRPSALQGVAHPLVASRSAPELRGAPSTQALRTEPPPPAAPVPGLAARVVHQVHPVAAGPGSPPQARHEGRIDTKHAPSQGTPVPGRPAPLVRSIGTFMLPADTRFEQDSDALTALTHSVHGSIQQQPDVMSPSSGEVTPLDLSN